VIGKPYLGITSRLPVIRPRIRARPDSFIYAGPSSSSGSDEFALESPCDKDSITALPRL